MPVRRRFSIPRARISRNGFGGRVTQPRVLYLTVGAALSRRPFRIHLYLS